MNSMLCCENGTSMREASLKSICCAMTQPPNVWRCKDSKQRCKPPACMLSSSFSMIEAPITLRASGSHNTALRTPTDPAGAEPFAEPGAMHISGKRLAKAAKTIGKQRNESEVFGNMRHANNVNVWKSQATVVFLSQVNVYDMSWDNFGTNLE